MLLLFYKCIFKASLSFSRVLRSMIQATSILVDYQTEAISDRSNHMTSVMLTFFKRKFHSFRLNVFLKVLWMGFTIRTYDTRCLHFLANIKLKKLLITVLKRSCDFSKPYNTCRVKFHCYRPNVSSKLFWMFHWFYDIRYRLWYAIPAFLLNTQLEQLQITILKRSRDLSKTIHCDTR